MSLLSASDKHTLYEKFRPFLKPSWKLDSAHYEMRSAGDDDGWSKFHRGGDIRKHIISRKSSFHRLHGLAKKKKLKKMNGINRFLTKLIKHLKKISEQHGKTI